MCDRSARAGRRCQRSTGWLCSAATVIGGCGSPRTSRQARARGRRPPRTDQHPRQQLLVRLLDWQRAPARAAVERARRTHGLARRRSAGERGE
jgi:hypothetical protein